MRIELFHTFSCALIARGFLDVVKNVVDRFFGVVAGDGALDIGEKFNIVFGSLEMLGLCRKKKGKRTLSYKPSLNSSLIACFRPLNPQSPFSSSRAGMPRNSSIAACGSDVFICLAL